MTARHKKSLGTTFGDIRADYDMSRESRFVRRRVGLAPQGGSADYHYRVEEHYYRDIEKARDMDRNDSIVGQTVDRAVANIVQDGFSLDPSTGDKKLDQDLWQRFSDWSQSCEMTDVAEEFNFRDYENKAMRSTLLDGDCIVLGTDTGQLQFIEAHSIQTSTRIPNTFCGVTLSPLRKREKYWYMADGVTPSNQKESAVGLAVRNSDNERQLFHMYHPKRMNQTRGVTAFAPIFALAGMFEDINFAKLVQQQVVSCFAIFRQQALSGGSVPSVDGYGDSSTETTQAGTRQLEGVSPGMEIIGAPGETLQGFSPNVPNSEYFQHVRMMLQLIGVNLGLPLCLVLMDGSETNFSGWRGAVDEARKGFKENQQNLIKRFHRPVYEFLVRQWMSQDSALRSAAKQDGINILAHKWNAPTWQYIDPVGDANGDILRLQNSLTSPRRLHSEGGRDWEIIVDETIDDYAYAIEKAKNKSAELNKKFQDGQPIHWRELMPIAMPAGMQLTMNDPGMVAAQQAQSAGALQAGTGEMSTLNRRQFSNNQKAITDLLNALIENQMSESRVRVGLSALGLSPQNVDLLIQDAKDGTVDTDLTKDNA
jgi:lambda family phage portal protein